MSDRPTEVRSGVPCTLCGRTLFPVPSGPDVTFHCRNGHGFGIEELLRAQSAKATRALEALAEEWEAQAQSLFGTAEDARAHGFTDIADLFVRRAERLDRKVETLRAAFRRDESSKLVAISPDLLKPRPFGRR